MTNFDRNTRTLIVSFLVAIFTLIPLRFIEVGTQQSLMGGTQVLGETMTVPAEETRVEPTVEEVKLEAPYDELESCVTGEEIKVLEDEVVNQLENNTLSEDQIMAILDEMKRVKDNICR